MTFSISPRSGGVMSIYTPPRGSSSLITSTMSSRGCFTICILSESPKMLTFTSGRKSRYLRFSFILDISSDVGGRTTCQKFLALRISSANASSNVAILFSFYNIFLALWTGGGKSWIFLDLLYSASFGSSSRAKFNADSATPTAWSAVFKFSTRPLYAADSSRLTLPMIALPRSKADSRSALFD